MSRHIISALVANRSGVLTRVAGLFARRGYNIDSLTVCGTENPDLSRMTIVTDNDTVSVTQIILQLDKLIDVITITELDPAHDLMRELLIIKVEFDAKKGGGGTVEEICKRFDAKVISKTSNAKSKREKYAIEIMDEPQKLDELIAALKEFNIVGVARTGLVAIAN
jgi:acetolactate synthase-1/3 small subunit